MTEHYTTTQANNGERSVLLVGWRVKAVFVEPDHAELAAKVAELLNEHEAAKDERKAATA